MLRYATAEDIVGLNPHLNPQLTLALMSSNTMAWLVKYDRRNRPVPELALAVPSRANGGISSDGKTITYRLRRDAKWSDGVPFTADDVRFSVGVVLNPANNEGTHEGFDLIRRVDVPDPYTVVFHLVRAYSGFYVNFFSSAGANPCILPKHLLAGEKTINQAAYNALPVGIGPFKYASWKRGDSVELVADPLYFGRKPKLTKVDVQDHSGSEHRAHPARDARDRSLGTGAGGILRARSGAAGDRCAAPSLVRVQPSRLRGRARRAAATSPCGERSGWRSTGPTILAKIRHGVGVLQETPFAPGHPLHVDLPLVPVRSGGRAPAARPRRLGSGRRRRARQRRPAAGLRDGDRHRAAGHRRDRRADSSVVAPIGVGLELKHYPSPIYFAPAATGGIVFGGKFDVAMFAWFTSPNGDLTNLLPATACRRRATTSCAIATASSTRAMQRQVSTYDEQAQRAASRAVQSRLAAQVPTVVLDARVDVYAFNDDLRGFRPNQVTPFDDLVDADI